MEKSNKSFDEKRCASNKSVMKDNKTEDALNQKIDTFRENQVSCEILVPKLKNIFIGRRNSDNHLKEDMDENFLENTTEISSEEENDDCAEDASDEDAEMLECSAIMKSSYFKKTMMNYIKSALPNPTETLKNIKFIKRKDESAKTPKSETLANLGIQSATQTKSLPEDENLSLCSTQCDSISQHGSVNSYQSSKVRSEEEVWEHFKWYMKSNIKSLDRVKTDDIGKVDIKPFIESGIQNFENPAKTAAKSLDNQKSEYPMDTATLSEGYDLEYPTKTVPKYSSQDSNHVTKVDIKSLSESGNRRFGNAAKTAAKSFDNQKSEYPVDTTTLSECHDLESPIKTVPKCSNQDSKLITKAVMISAMKNDAVKVVSEASSARVEKPNTVIENEKNIPRKRIIYDERDEYIRWWILKQIKDREILLKFSILEGEYSEDTETKLRCIEDAEDLQDETDELFDELDDYQKMTRNSLKRRIRFLKSPQKKKKRLEGQINSFSSLFFHLYKYSKENEDIFEGMILEKFISAYEKYARSQRKIENESKTLEYNAKWQVVKLHFSLAQCRSKVKCKIAHPENKTFDDYQNFVNDLKMAAKKNLQCLNTILPRSRDIIFPLMRYLNQSGKKYKRATGFLEKERSDVFSKDLDKNKAFFEKFCSQYFKN